MNISILSLILKQLFSSVSKILDKMKLNDEELTKVILDSLGEGLFTVDKDFRVNSINRAAE